MRNKYKIKKYAFGMLMTIVTLLSSLLGTATNVSAAELQFNESTGYSYRGVSPHLGYEVYHNPIYKMKMDGKTVFCVESGIFAINGGGYIPESYTSAKKDVLSKIAYYGYTITGKTNYDYAVTQVMIWEELGDKFISTSIPNYQTRKAEIMIQVNKHNTVPSWNNQTVKVIVGETVTVNDSNGILSGMNLTSNTTSTTVSKNGNSLSITAHSTSKDGTITYQKVPNNLIGTSIIYKKPKEQSLVEFHLENTVQAKINVDVIHLGNLQIQKIDETTNKPLPNTKLKFEYSGKVKELVTDANGLAQLYNIPEGTIVTVTEVTAPNGYFNKGEIKKITIEPNKTITAVMNNKPQQGMLSIKKTGKQVSMVEKKDTEYGELVNIKFDYQPLAGVTYEITTLEDIMIGSVTRAKAGDVVATVITDKNGELINMPRLFLGKYQAVEIDAPNGYIIDSTPMPFEFTYQGQEIELTTTSLKQSNEFQKLKLVLHKNEEVLKGWKDNLPLLEYVKANDKVFGLYTNEEIKLSNDEVILKDSLINYGTVANGELVLKQLQYPHAKYYFKELDSGDKHALDTKKYEFEFTSEDHHRVKEIHIFDTHKPDSVDAILNKLHFNEFSLKKLNEVAKLDKSNGYIFDYTGTAKGAMFTLEDENNKIIQTITINDESIGVFKNIPVGNFYLREKSTSSNDYLLSNEIYKVESTKSGIKIFNQKNELVANQSLENQDTSIVVELKNELVKGSVNFTKLDGITKDVLANADIQILDKDMKIVISGKTNIEGKFKYESLPKGKYYIKEINAPEGYQLSNEIIPFEINENGKVVECSMLNYKIGTKLPQTGDARGAATSALATMFLSSGVLLSYLAYRKKLKK